MSDLEYVIVEPNGNISVFPKAENKPVTRKDLNLRVSYEGLAYPLIIDGEIQYNNLKFANLSINWLNDEIKKAGARAPEEVFIAQLDSQRGLYVDLYNNNLGGKPPYI